ncbi:hypothetical protein RDI58_024387 [Solanum bulbocastanum]|uniref:Uncharacterized protein n=1 Tax=Solanum bulbocastanum TaxID=147425 RepID=A0AAN8Y3A1_SOLBU
MFYLPHDLYFSLIQHFQRELENGRKNSTHPAWRSNAYQGNSNSICVGICSRWCF